MGQVARDPAETPWHSLSAEEALQALGSAEDGLDAEAAEARRERFGRNVLPEEKRAGVLRVFLRQFKDPLIYILLIAGSVSLATGYYNNAVFIFLVLLINSLVATFQEWRAESSAASLKAVITVRARVRRKSKAARVDAEDLVPGDVVELDAGDSVPADIRLLSGDNLHADESLLSGESLPVAKSADASLEEDTPLAERETLLHAGSVLLDGRGTGVVCRTGALTEVGRIAESLAAGETQAPPLVIKLEQFTRWIGIVILGAVALIAIVQTARGVEPIQIFFLGVALAVSAIPAGLPVAVTVAMSAASTRMARRQVIVRKLPAVEGLGSCTLVASDKTGTLTENVLTVKGIQLDGGDFLAVEGDGYEPQGEITRDGEALDDQAEQAVNKLAVTGALCNEGEFEVTGDGVRHEGDSVDVAFLALAAKCSLSRPELLEQHGELASIPFESSQRFAASLNAMDDEAIAHVKGASEAVVAMCDGVDLDRIQSREKELAREGYRVLALARGPVDADAKDDFDADRLKGLEFLGLAALIDPIRAEVPEAVKRCRKAGVDVRIITGDHPDTGLAIARRLGIADDDDEAVTGAELKALDEDERRRRFDAAPVFARVEPTQKDELVEALQDEGYFVAVTGDGVNDAPALKRAHIGVAMGESGTDVAREASDLILTDDNFASIVDGIEEGRIAYDNVRKVVWLLLSTGAAEVLLFFLALATGLPLPLTPVQLLWLNLVTNGVQDVGLALEQGEPGVLERKPHPPDQPIFDRELIRETLLSGGYMGGVAFALYYYLLVHAGLGGFEASNLLLLLMVLFENMHVLSCRSERRSLLAVPPMGNPWLLLGILIAHGIHIGAMFVPGLSEVLGVAPVSPTTWLLLFALAATLLLFDESAKTVERLRRRPAHEAV